MKTSDQILSEIVSDLFPSDREMSDDDYEILNDIQNDHRFQPFVLAIEEICKRRYPMVSYSEDYKTRRNDYFMGFMKALRIFTKWGE